MFAMALSRKHLDQGGHFDRPPLCSEPQDTAKHLKRAVDGRYLQTRGLPPSRKVCRFFAGDLVQAKVRQCQANAIPRSGLCFFHDPERAVDRTMAQRAGGLRNKAASLPAETPDCALSNAADVTTLLGMSINQVRRGEIDPRVANAIGYLSATLLKALELGNLEQRVSDLERATKSQPQSGSVLDKEEFEFVLRSTDDEQKTVDAN